MPANAILVPGTILAGPATHLDSLSSVQVMPEAFIGPEYLKPGDAGGLAAHDAEQIGANAVAAVLLDIVADGAAREDGLALDGIAAAKAGAGEEAAAINASSGDSPDYDIIYSVFVWPLNGSHLHAHASAFQHAQNCPKRRISAVLRRCAGRCHSAHVEHGTGVSRVLARKKGMWGATV